MTRLILTADDTGAGSLRAAGIADIVLPFDIRFVWGPLPSDAELATFLEARSTKHDSPGSHWLDFVCPLHLGEIEGINLGLTDFGNAVVTHKEDFSRHNPIDRWWGGTHLTNDRLWRWNPALVKP